MIAIPTEMRRNDRCFVVTSDKSHPSFFQSLRCHLRDICKAVQDDEGIQNKVAFVEKANVLKDIMLEQSKKLFTQMESGEGVTVVERKKIAKHFIHLSYNSSVDTKIPLEEAENLINFLSNCQAGYSNLSTVLMFANHLHKFNKEIAELISTSAMHNSQGIPSSEVISHLSYLASFVESIHDVDLPAEEPIPIDHTYNPPKFGRAFYFQNDGKQVRKMRKFTIDNQKKDSNNYDDKPEEACNKIFPQVSKAGMTYLFLWFCPMHGNCLGFHMIPGSEGRKDPAAALYTHLAMPPKVAFYDFACSLSEYVKNRESGYFRNTRFFHDVFHGFSHKCSPTFRCSSLNGFEQTNTSICEQFNSFIQRIKSSAKLLSQSHFTFYLQFFIHQWNQMQDKNNEKRSYNRNLGNMCNHPSQSVGLFT